MDVRVGSQNDSAARVLRCPICGKPLPPDTSLLNHYCTGKP